MFCFILLLVLLESLLQMVCYVCRRLLFPYWISYLTCSGEKTKTILSSKNQPLIISPNLSLLISLIYDQAKVSKLKRKCLERDQLLTKLLLKLQKKRGITSEDDEESPSISSSVQQIEDLLRSDTNDEDDDLASVQSLAKKGKGFCMPPFRLSRECLEDCWLISTKFLSQFSWLYGIWQHFFSRYHDIKVVFLKRSRF